jgi:hypothetical protein
MWRGRRVQHINQLLDSTPRVGGSLTHKEQSKITYNRHDNVRNYNNPLELVSQDVSEVSLQTSTEYAKFARSTTGRLPLLFYFVSGLEPKG